MTITSETIVIGLMVLLLVVVLWKVLIGFFKMGLFVFVLVAAVIGGYVIFQHFGVDFTSLQNASPLLNQAKPF